MRLKFLNLAIRTICVEMKSFVMASVGNAFSSVYIFLAKMKSQHNRSTNVVHQ